MLRAIHLKNFLLIYISFTFVSLIIYFTGKGLSYWHLYFLPILIAALTYQIIGALVTGAASAGAIAWWAYRGLDSPVVSSLSESVLQLALGTGVLLAAGISLGILSARQKKQQALLEHISIRDSLTGIYNHGYFTERFVEEIRRADRYEMPLSLIMIDVDRLEDFNNTFGREKGDKLLGQVSRLIRRSVRNVDIIARYGGEEFVVLLPNVNGDFVLDIAERVRKAVEMTDFEGDAEEPLAKKTVSAGVASYPSLAQDKLSLIAHSQKALDLAQRMGGNRVFAHQPKHKKVKNATSRKKN